MIPEYAMPYLLGRHDFNLTDPKSNKSQVDGWMDRNPIHVADHNGLNVYLLKGNQEGTLFAIAPEDGLAKYVISYEIHDILGHSAIRQVQIWRSSISGQTNNLTEMVFYQVLLEIRPIIVADSDQTEDGKKFWVRQISRALGYGLYVYIANLVDNKLIPVNTSRELELLSPTIWGKSMRHRSIFPLISKIGLKIE